MVRETEAMFTLKDGMQLFEKTWEPSEPPRAHLIFVHGFNDHSEIHYYLFQVLASPTYAISCHAIDQRGWGKSVRRLSQRGLTGPTSQVLADIDEYVMYVSTRKVSNPHSTPIFLMGHSMGGQHVLHYLLSTNPSLTKSRANLAGAVIEAPYIELDPSSQPAGVIVLIGKLAARISPQRQMKQNLDSRYISRDPDVNRAWREDPLCHDYGTLEGLRDMLDRAAKLARLSRVSNSSKVPKMIPVEGLQRKLPLPVYWAHGTADRITAFEPSRRLFKALEVSDDRSMFKAYDGAYHKIHAEPDGVGVRFAEDVGDWILRVVATRSPTTNDVVAEGDCVTVSVPRGSSSSSTSAPVDKVTEPQGDSEILRAKL